MLGKITCRFEKPAPRISKGDWDIYSWNFANQAEQQREDTLRIRHEGRSIRNEAGIQARWDVYKNNNRIRDRISEVDNWRVALELTVQACDKELVKMDQAKEAVEQAIEAKVIDMDIVNEVLSVRAQRRGNDNVMDDATMELTKETCLLKDSRNLLERKGYEAWQQIARLNEVRSNLIKDMMEKVVALDVDRYLLDLNDRTATNAYRPDLLRVPTGMVTSQTWEENSRYNKGRADCELASSVKLREAMLITVDQTNNDLRAQREITDFAMRKRLHEMQKAASDLAHQRQKLLQEMCKVEREIKELEDGVMDKQNKMKLVETRLENRTYRYGPELARDDPHCGLQQELLQLRAALRAIQIKLSEARKALSMLNTFLQQLEDELENKNETIAIEKQALDIRGRLEARDDTSLTKTDRNIALSATVPVPEDRRRESGELGRGTC